MANALYTPAKVLALTTGMNLASGTVKCALVDTGVYTFDATHQFYSSVSSAVIGTPQTLASKTTTGGVFDADDVTFTAVSGDSIEAVVIYIDSGDDATSPLIAYFDTASGLPLIPSGADINLNWSSGSSKIFAL